VQQAASPQRTWTHGCWPASPSPNIEVRQTDLVSDPLPAGEFDFVHTRPVLMHIPAREQVLGRLCAALRPGGILMTEEQDAFPVLATATGAYREAWLAFIRACRAAGTDPDRARDLPLRLRRHGLAGIGAELDVPLFRGGSAHARFWSLTWQQVPDRVAAAGEPAHVIDQGQAELSDEQRWFHGPATTTAYRRRARLTRDLHPQQAGVEAIPLPFHFGKPAGLGCLPPAPRQQPWRRWHPLGCSPSGQAYTA
jgi:SAM-dependent methyltransferase